MSKKEWTIMLYMAGDNNLAVNMAYAMGQLKEFANEANGKLNLFVYYDGNSPVTPTLYCDFSEKDPKYYRSHLIADKPFKITEKRINENAADPGSILNFVDWCVNRQSGRAERYAFIFSGHSLGFLGEGLFRDETSGKSMNLSDLMYALDRMTACQEFVSNVKANPSEFNNCNPWGDDKYAERFLLGDNAHELLGRQLDILGFDSCVMGMFEVGSQFRHCAKTMIVSEGSIPSAGWTYAKLLRDLCEGTDKTTEELAAGLVENYIKGQSEFVIGGVSVDMAAWNMDKFIELQVLIGMLTSNLLKCFAPGSPLYVPMERAILKVHWKCQSYMYDQNVDLGDFCELLLQECDCIEQELGSGDHNQLLSDLKWNCKDILQALQDVVIQSGFSGGRYQYSNGVSIFFPWSLEAYEAAEADYNTLWATTEASGFSQTSSLLPWSEFLKTYLRDVSRRKSEDYTKAPLAGKKIRKVSPFNFSDGLLDDMHGLTKQAGQEGTKQAGQEGTKQAGQEGTKQAGQEGTKQAGQEGTKQAGQEGTKQAGQEGTKQAGQEGTKQAGQEGTKMGSGGASNLLFDSLRLWKNIEAHQDIYGFTHAPTTEATTQDLFDGSTIATLKVEVTRSKPAFSEPVRKVEPAILGVEVVQIPEEEE
ncbi:MAG TPA: clostripain-related cysteine peptidase [Blastocatellia bacterium]|nr:clostripain-related cysteine peptidase [Blastocatellia bacterium]